MEVETVFYFKGFVAVSVEAGREEGGVRRQERQ
jgi:hypothetical protein